MDFPTDLEAHFQILTDITDDVAKMNYNFDATPEIDIPRMLEFQDGIKSLEWESTPREYFDLFCSYFTFHVKIVEEIIAEAREILNPDNRDHVKRLVAYSKECNEWFSSLKKKRKPQKNVA
jgi:hypothetical protein